MDYSYDAQSRVTQMHVASAATHNYDYDASGNLNPLPDGTTGIYDNAG